MRAESTVKPAAPFDIEVDGDVAIIRFYQNLEPTIRIGEDGESEEGWAYDEYVLRIPNRDGLAAQVEQHYAKWLQLAIAQELTPRAETAKETIDRLQTENAQLMLELSAMSMDLEHLQGENAFILLELAKGEL